MLDENEAPVAPQEQHLAFNRQALRHRVAIVLAGPLFNFLFAAIALSLVFMIGIKSFVPIVGEVKPGSVAALAGLNANDEILSVNGQLTKSWYEVQAALIPLYDSKKNLDLTVKALNASAAHPITLALANAPLNDQTDLLEGLGLSPFLPPIPPVIGEVASASPAQNAGLQRGDRILAVNGEPINDWLVLVNKVKSSQGLLHLSLLRDGRQENISVQVEHITKQGQTQAYLGVYSKPMDWPPGFVRWHRESPFMAVRMGVEKTFLMTKMTFQLIGRLFIGQVSLKTLSGPVGIAQGAGESARSGGVYYLSFLALLSISLGVLNLMPIPLLDGGHLLYYFFEWIHRRPLSEGVKSIGLYVGLVFLVTLMIIALKNDLTRLI
jgi:regulator of sigma E protease